MSKYTLQAEITLPESILEVGSHLGLVNYEAAKWAWLEISGAVLGHYLVDRQQRFNALLNWFYNELGFCAATHYFSIEAADLGSCLVKRKGNSTTLGTVLMMLAQQLDLDVKVILLPNYAVLRCKINDELYYVDPIDGAELTRHQLHVLVRGELGNAAELKAAYLNPVDKKQLMTRSLHELKGSCIVANSFEVALEVCNLLLQWNKDDVNLHRERAFIAQKLGCIKVAAADLRHFIDNSPHDPVTDIVKIQLKELKAHTEVYH